MNGLTLRTAERRDLGPLDTLERAAFATDRMSRRALRYSLTAKTRLVIVLACGHRLLASAVVCVRRSHLRLYSIAVDEAARGLGLGSMLLNAVEQIGLRMGRRSIRLEVRTDNVAALALYSSRAYVCFGHYSAFYEDGCNALRLHKQVTAQPNALSYYSTVIPALPPDFLKPLQLS